MRIGSRCVFFCVSGKTHNIIFFFFVFDNLKPQPKKISTPLEDIASMFSRKFIQSDFFKIGLVLDCMIHDGLLNSNQVSFFFSSFFFLLFFFCWPVPSPPHSIIFRGSLHSFCFTEFSLRQRKIHFLTLFPISLSVEHQTRNIFSTNCSTIKKRLILRRVKLIVILVYPSFFLYTLSFFIPFQNGKNFDQKVKRSTVELILKEDEESVTVDVEALKKQCSEQLKLCPGLLYIYLWKIFGTITIQKHLLGRVNFKSSTFLN